MPDATLTRFERAAEHTLGILSFSDHQFYTMEPPWEDNEIGKSCIPTGEYVCVQRKSPKYGWTYWLEGTEPRSFILIHGGNLARHTRGCILPGFRRGILNGKIAVLNSKRAVGLIHSYFEREPFDLQVIWGNE